MKSAKKPSSAVVKRSGAVAGTLRRTPHCLRSLCELPFLPSERRIGALSRHRERSRRLPARSPSPNVLAPRRFLRHVELDRDLAGHC